VFNRRIAVRKPIIAYLRVSTDRQGKSGLGLDAQRDAVARFAQAEDMEIISELVEVETGKGSDALDRRPMLREALALARKMKAAICVGQARPAEPRRALHRRPDGVQSSVHRDHAWRRCRPIHAAHLRRLRREGTRADLRVNARGAGAQEGAGRGAGQPDQSR
jgi:hypothetical protein